jgi:lipopolysaccharide biosynthesis glycosyltransferase
MYADREGQIFFCEIADEQVSGLPIQPLFGPAMWYRILLPELLGELNRVLYLDADTVVVDDLSPLAELDLGDHLLAAVTNVFMPYHRFRPAELGIAPSAYFNSGVLLLNLEQMRSDGFTAAVRQLATGSRGASLTWPDQDALNLAVQDRWQRLHPRWNCMNSIVNEPELADEVFGPEQTREALSSPAIRHFEGEGLNKPWHAMHPRAGRRLYRAHRRATPWPRYEFTDDTAALRIKRLGGLRG